MIYKIKDVIKFFVGYVWSLFLKNKDIWVITERRNECKDNGFHLFKYIRVTYPTKNVYYAIERNSVQRRKIEAFQNILDFNSIKHYAYALAASKLIGAFLPCGIPDSMCFYKYGNKFIRGKKCFLQHGITMGDINSLKYSNTGIDLFVCGAEPEYHYIKNNFGYPKDNIKYTGFARFDALKIRPQNRSFILLMPTWRQYMSSQTWGIKKTCFEETVYFQAYNHLISNKHLIALLEECNVDLVFYPHHEVQGELYLFTSMSKNIHIASEKDYDVQSLLKDASLLITDYSSVAFDFAYMDKPVLYYQFDEEEYYSKHYQRGYFDYKQMGFGPICNRERHLVDEIKKYIENGFKNSLEYQYRAKNFFVLRDNKNCERIFNEISKL